MAQVETTGGGFVDSGDRSIERKVVVSSDGTLTRPSSSLGWPLTNVSITREPGGVLRGVYEFSQGGEGDASYNQYGKRIELTGGTREVPIYNHPDFAALTPSQIQEVQDAVENKTQGPFASAGQTTLFGFLVRGTEYYLAPSIVGRVSRIESNLPSLAGIAKVANPPELNAPAGNFWICTAITATPVGNRYEVTREFTLSPSAWADVQALYS